jgi:hypothetical protein
MKKILTVLLVCFSFLGYAQWYTVNSFSIVTSGPYNLDYTADSAIFITSQQALYFSKNNGASFTTISSPSTTPTNAGYSNRIFSDISFANKDTGIIGGDVYNGGYSTLAMIGTGTYSNWRLAALVAGSGAMNVVSVKSFGKKTAYIYDYANNFCVTHNNGTSWQLKNVITGVTGCDMSFVDSLNGYFCSNAGNYKTTNGGTTISAAGNFPSGFTIPKRVKFLSPNIGFAIARNSAGQYKLFRTVNGGMTWTDIMPGHLPDILVDMSFPSKDTGYVISDKYVLNTNDGGASWYINRFVNKTLQEVDFIHNTCGLILSTKPSLIEAMAYDENSPSTNPFALFDFTTNYCCVSQVCNIINYGLPAWNYKWYVNGSLASTSFTPFSLVLATSGNNTVKLVVDNGVGKDSVSLTMYNAPVYAGSSAVNLYCADSTICVGSSTSLTINPAYTGLTYYITSGSNSISTTYPGNGFNINMGTTALTFNDTILTVVEQTVYPNCPGNKFTKNQNIKVLPLPPNNLLSLPRDSICKNDSGKVALGPMTTGTSYTVCLSAFFTQISSGLTGQTKVLTFGPQANTTFPYYNSTDSNGCVSLASPKLKLKVDSTWAKLYASVPACVVGDTIVLINQSVSTHYTWYYDAGTQVISNNDTTVKLKYGAVGSYSLNLYSTNNTGCKDSVLYKIGVYNSLNQGGGTLCFNDSTVLVQDLKQFTWSNNFHSHMKMHVDRGENYYVTQNVFYGDPADGAIYGLIGYKIAKYSPGGVLQWTAGPDFTNLGIGVNFDYVHSTINSITTDADGNVYFAGNFRGSRIQDNWLYFDNYGTSSGVCHAYVTKLDSNGKLRWIVRLNSEHYSGGHPVGVGNIITDKNIMYLNITNTSTITCTDTVSNGVSPTSGSWTTGQHELLVIDTAGKFISRKSICYDPNWLGYTFIDRYSGITYGQTFAFDHKITKYKDKLIHVSISASPTVCLNTGQNIASTSNLYAYVVVTDTLGNVLNYFKPIAFFNASYFELLPEFVPQFTVDKDGFLYFTWNYEQNYNMVQLANNWYSLNPYNKYNYSALLSNGTTLNFTDQTGLLMKYDLTGNLIWYKKQNYFNTTSLVANNDGNIYGLGQFYNLAGFESSDGNNQLVTGTPQLKKSLLYCYDNSGNFLWGKPFNSNAAEYSKDIAIKDSCNDDIYFMMGYDTTIHFMSGTQTTNQRMNIFKMSTGASCSTVACGNFTTNASTHFSQTEKNKLFSLFPNPTSGSSIFYPVTKKNMKVKVFDAYGNLVKNIEVKSGLTYTIDLSSEPDGIYFVIAECEGKTQKEKVVVTR